jgi:FKBP-type peptidyl-prolyl cis-trans isomerase FklB
MMRGFIATIALTLAATPALAQDLESDSGKLGYALGWRMGQQIQAFKDIEDIDVQALITAINDSTAGVDPKVDLQELRLKLGEFENKARERQLEELQRLAEENQAKANEFLEANQSKTGIVQLPSGVQYRIIEEGDGPRPGIESTVKVHYRSSKIDSTEIDSSFARGVPEEVVVNNVLQGWQEVLPLMKQGSTWQIFVPPELGFGARGNPPAIGPNEALMFDLKLIEIVNP